MIEKIIKLIVKCLIITFFVLYCYGMAEDKGQFFFGFALLSVVVVLYLSIPRKE